MTGLKCPEKTLAKWISIQMDLDKYPVMSGHMSGHVWIYVLFPCTILDGWIDGWMEEDGRGGGWRMRFGKGESG